MKKILITGANFWNKGAQSMLFITVDELRRRFPDADILFQTNDKIDLSNYRFRSVSLNRNSWRYVAGGFRNHVMCALSCARKIVACVLKRQAVSFQELSDSRELEDTDLILDISGFSLADQWSFASNFGYILKVQAAKKRGIPIYLMPQSFGPFQYQKKFGARKGSYLLKGLKDCLQYPNIIFCRERAGVAALKELGIEKNVVLSSDLVLQNQAIDHSHIFHEPPEINYPHIPPGNNVAIVPNSQCKKRGDKQRILELYRKIIAELCSMGKNVYICRHSTQDAGFCDEIFQYAGDSQIHLINEDLSAFAFDELTKSFDFLICSRFHGCVHALRNNVPCIALGWAVKYRELLGNVGQESFVFSITDGEIQEDAILRSIGDMNSGLEEQKRIIESHLSEIRRHNCFEFLDHLT